MKSVYERLGVTPIINAAGAYTELGGGLMPPEVTEAMVEAAREYVDLHNLLDKSGKYLAKLLDVEAAFITAGAAAGLMLAAAACLTRCRSSLVHLPATDDCPNDIVVHRSHVSSYLQMFRLAGANIVEIGSPSQGTELVQLRRAICQRTAAVAHFTSYERPGDLPLPDVIGVAHEHEIPVIVDAAPELPPVSNLTAFTRLGADLVVFSGGKALRGPQSTGLILGRRDLVDACRELSSPHERFGRALKVAKEEIVGLVVAVERYLALDHDREARTWEGRLSELGARLSGIPQIRLRRVHEPHSGAPIPRLYLEFDLEALAVSRRQIAEALREGNPPIYCGQPTVSSCALSINPSVLRPGDVNVIADRVIAVVASLCSRQADVGQ